jgi:maleate isomerase
MSPAALGVGVLTPHEAPGPEVELPSLTHGVVTVTVVRAGSPSDLRASTAPSAIALAASTFGSQGIDAVAHASTTAGYVLGRRAEAELVERLSDACGVPAVASCAAAVAALRAHAVERVQLVHPPWFAHELDDLGAACFREQGLDVVVSKAADLPNDPAHVQPSQVVAWVEQHLDDRADAVFLAGNGFRAAGAIDELERRTGRLVLEANQVLLWAVLAATGTRLDIEDAGRLLGGGPTPITSA